MKKIKKLSKNIIDKIISLSIKKKKTYTIKELIENSCDAKSTNIKLHIEDNNNEEIIKIIDNGEGIYKDDLYKIFLLHTTNKLTDEKDLNNNIHTYGFKGESLNKIKCLAELIIISKPIKQKEAYKITFNKNKYVIEKCSGKNGTEIIIKNIKKDEIEKETDIYFYFKMLALVNFDIHFQLYKNNLEIYNLPKCYSNFEKAQRIEKIIGKDALKKSIDIDYKKNNINIKGLFSINENNKKFEIIFLNNRYIKNEKIKKCLTNLLKKEHKHIKLNYCIFFYMPQEKYNIVASIYKIKPIFYNLNEMLDILKELIFKYKKDLIEIKDQKYNKNNVKENNNNYYNLNKNLINEALYKNNNTILTIINNETLFFEYNQKVYTVKIFNLREKIIINEVIEQLNTYGKIKKRAIHEPITINLKKNINTKKYKSILDLYGFDILQLLNKNIIIYNVPEIIFNLEIDWHNLINDMLITLENNITSYFSKNKFDMNIIKTFTHNIKKINPVYNFEIENINKNLKNILANDLQWINNNCKIYKK